MVQQEMHRLWKRAKEWAEWGKAHNQVKPSPRREWAIENEESESSPRHKKSRTGGRMCREASRPWQTQRASFWHTQKLSTRKVHASPICTQPIQKVVGHRLEVRGYGLAVGRKENLFWDSCSGSFGGDVLLGWHTTQKKQGWAGTTRCMPWGIGRERAPTL